MTTNLPAEQIHTLHVIDDENFIECRVVSTQGQQTDGNSNDAHLISVSGEEGGELVSRDMAVSRHVERRKETLVWDDGWRDLLIGGRKCLSIVNTTWKMKYVHRKRPVHQVGEMKNDEGVKTEDVTKKARKLIEKHILEGIKGEMTETET